MLTKPSLSSGFVEKGLPEPWMTPEAGGEKQDGRQLKTEKESYKRLLITEEHKRCIYHRPV